VNRLVHVVRRKLQVSLVAGLLRLCGCQRPLGNLDCSGHLRLEQFQRCLSGGDLRFGDAKLRLE
jgi:hypothetical protein